MSQELKRVKINGTVGANVVAPGDVVGDPKRVWVQSTAEEYIDSEIEKVKNWVSNTPVTNVVTVSSLPQSGNVNTLYRAAGTNTYSEYGWDGTQFVKLDEKDYGIDDEPTAGSDNLVKSGGVAEELALGAVYDVSAKNPTAGPNNDGKWESLSALLSDANLGTLIPTSVRKGGMSIKFVLTSDNKYVQYRYIGTDVTTATLFTNVNNWDEVGYTAQKISELGFIPTAPLSPSESNNWKLLGNGLCSGDESYKMVKYLVNEGDVLRLHISKESGGVMQFQNAASVPASGANGNLVGSTYTNAVDELVEVPAGATYLIVSQLKTTTTNVVEKKVSVDNVPTLWSENLVKSGGVSGYVNSKVEGYVHPIYVNKNNLITKTGYFSSYNGYNAYVFDVRALKGRTIILDEVERVNSYLFAFVTDYATIPTSENTELWENLLVWGIYGYSTGNAFEYECIVPMTANYLVLSGTDANPAALREKHNMLDNFEKIETESENIYSNEYDIVKLKGNSASMKPIMEIEELLNNGNVSGNDIGYLFNYGSGYKTSVFDVGYLDETTKIDVSSVIYTHGYVWAFCKDYRTLPIKSEFDNNSRLWLDNIVSSYSGRGKTTGTVYTGSIYKPKDAKYLLLVSNSSNQASANILADDGVLNIKDNSIPSITFSVTGHYIKSDGSIGNSTNWKQSNIFELKKGQKLIFSAKATGQFGVLLAKTNNVGSAYFPVLVGSSNIKKYEFTSIEDGYYILQYYIIEGDPSIINDSIRIVSLEDNVETLKANNSIVPTYLQAEENRVYRELVNRTNGKNSIIAFDTDQHINLSEIVDATSNPKYVLHGIQSIVNIARKMPIDFVVLGGDVAGYDNVVSNKVDGILEEINTINKPLAEINTPVISIPGNHDAFQNNANITAHGMYNVNFKRSKFVKGLIHSGNDNCDSYCDDEDLKIRYIFVDTYSQNVRTESYATFLSNALSSMGEGYKAIIFSHNPLTNEFAGIVKAISSSGQEIDAFQDPADLHSTINQYAENVVACICGHSHCDAWGINNSGILFIETTTAAPHTIAHTEDGIPYQKTVNSVTETAFDFFVVDLENQTIEAVRYGQGTNRKWKYKGTGQGLISYKNCVSGAISIPSLTLTFTNSSDNTDVANVTCDGNGFYEVYLTLGSTYTITCSGYTLDVNSVEVSENKVVDIEATSE